MSAAGFEDLDYEDELPDGQDAIVTSSVKRIHMLLDFVMDSHERTGYTCNGVVTGPAGLGKTIAIRSFLDRNPVRTHTGLPACVRVKVGMKSTAGALAHDITQTLNQQPKAKKTNDATNEAIEALRRSDLHLLLIDEADGLDVVSFELLRRLHDRTGCPIVLVGLPQIYRVIESYEKYESRIGMFVTFDPLTEDEVVTTVLPQMAITGWTYDPTNAADRAMGVLLWKKVAPSFRKLRVVLSNASQFAQRMQHDRITPEDIQLAMAISLKPKRPNNRREDTRKGGSYEETSEERHRGKDHTPSADDGAPADDSTGPESGRDEASDANEDEDNA